MRKGRFLALASAFSLVLAGPAWAQVKQGDLDLTFHSQVEVDFEVRSNYSFNENVNAINTREDFFVEQENRFWLDAKAGPFESRVMIETEDFWDTAVAEGGIGAKAGEGTDLVNIEQAYGGYDFGWFKTRIGLQVFQLDPAEIVYIDDDFGVRFWQTYEWGGWNFFWVFNEEGTSTAAANPNRDRHYFMGNLDLKLAGWTVTPFVAYATAKDEPVLSGKSATETLEVWWLGAGAKGSVAGINVLAQFAYATGDQDLRAPLVNAGQNNLDISAWAGMLSLAYPIPATPITIEAAGVWMSGDDDPTDADAEGYQGIFQDTELLNPQGIWIDDEIVIAPQRAGLPQSCRAAACAGTFAITTDDDFSPNGADFNFDAQGVTSVFAAANPVNPGNFGLQYYHAGLHYKATSNVTVSAMFAYILAMEDGLLGGDSHIGNEYTVQAVWTPHKYFRVTPTLSWLVPGDAIENLVGDDATAFNFTLETMFLF